MWYNGIVPVGFKVRLTDVADQEQMFRIIQSISLIKHASSS